MEFLDVEILVPNKRRRRTVIKIECAFDTRTIKIPPHTSKEVSLRPSDQVMRALPVWFAILLRSLVFAELLEQIHYCETETGICQLKLTFYPLVASKEDGHQRVELLTATMKLYLGTDLMLLRDTFHKTHVAIWLTALNDCQRITRNQIVSDIAEDS